MAQQTALRKRVAFIAIFCIFMVVLYQVVNPERISGIPSQIFEQFSSSGLVNSVPEPSLIEHGLDGRLVWNSLAVPETRFIRHAPGTHVHNSAVVNVVLTL